jgi:S-adenosylmethionine:tRNA ribosyltransferase-isomerase
MHWMTADFRYDLPPELIAAYPPPLRTDARLMVLHREEKRWTHARFTDLAHYLSPSDLLVLNNSQVLPSYLESEDGRLTALLMEETSPRHWIALVKPGKLARPHMRCVFANQRTGARVEAEVLKTLPTGERVFRFFSDVDLNTLGEMPLPPYIVKRRAELAATSAEVFPVADRERYQTTYAQVPGSVAAPTAGLHFTPEVLAQFPHAFVTLHVGLGTFRPVKTERLDHHEMHRERFEIGPGLAEAVAQAKRLVAVGTTSARVLESALTLDPQQGSTNIFIYPPYDFKRVQALVTNFHLPQSTLLMLVCAFAGVEFTLAAYREAVRERYRFFSYGDAMLIL